MPADLTAIRALLASVEGFTPGPWRHANKETAHVVSSECTVHCVGFNDWAAMPGSHQRWIADASLIAAAPTLHAHLTELADEVERLQDENGHLAALVKAGAWETSLAVAPLNAELERLRAHNVRMAALLNKVADAMDDAEYEAWDDGAEIVTNALPVVGELRALAAGEVDDG